LTRSWAAIREPRNFVSFLLYRTRERERKREKEGKEEKKKSK
jgi:hypothetical protein